VKKDNFRETRIPVELKATYTMGDIIGEGLLTDMSANGIAMRTNQVFVVGDKIEVQSEISDNLTLEFTGEIKNVQGNMIGVLITKIDSRIRERFMEHVNGMLRLMKSPEKEKYSL
jgi:hypothetical protein